MSDINCIDVCSVGDLPDRVVGHTTAWVRDGFARPWFRGHTDEQYKSTGVLGLPGAVPPCSRIRRAASAFTAAYVLSTISHASASFRLYLVFLMASNHALACEGQ